MQVCVLAFHLRLETSFLDQFGVVLSRQGTFTRCVLHLAAEDVFRGSAIRFPHPPQREAVSG